MEMLKKLLCLSGFLLGLAGAAQECPVPVFPEDGDFVPVDVTLTWTEVLGITSYKIRLGTTPGGSEIQTLTSTGLDTFYTPTQGLPENSTIFVELYIFNRLTGDQLCDTYSFNTQSFTSPPECTEMISPADGQVNVPVQSDLRWSYSATATSYRISAGTSPGGTDLLNNALVTDGLTFDPSFDWPEETEVFVRIIPENRLGPADGCEEFRFTTGPLATLPECSSILYPSDGEFDIPLSPRIRWTQVTGAEGYRVSIGTSPSQSDILNNADFGNQTETGVIDFEPNRQYFVTIVPYNIAGEALNCDTTSFFTLLGCGPFFDPDGNLIDFSPELNFPETVGICSIGAIEPITSTDQADGYRWYGIENQNREVLLEQGPVFSPPGPGEYRLEIYNEISDPSGVSVECASSRIFSVTQSEPAIIEETDVDLGVGVLTIEVTVSGIGDYEFALNDPEGPYQDSNRFSGLPLGNYRVFVRDRNGCGVTEVLVEPDLTLEGFPKFFTPNGDGINDFWQFILPPSGVSPIRRLFIFDRFGNLLAQVDPQTAGWDGTFNGRPMPASDYWFRAINNNNQEIRGHFSLKR